MMSDILGPFSGFTRSSGSNVMLLPGNDIITWGGVCGKTL